MTRPMVVRFGALGDMVLMTAPIRVLSEAFGSPVDVLGSGPWTKPLLQGQPGVGEIYLVERRSWPYWLSPNQQAIVRRLRERGTGPAWLFDSRNDKTHQLLERAGWRAEQLTELERLPDIADEHFCDRWCRFALLAPPFLGDCLQSAGNASATPWLQLPPQVRDEVGHWISRLGLASQRFMLIQAGNKRTMRRGARHRPSNTKYWPEERWAQVIRGLRALHPDLALLLLGVSAEVELNDRILAIAQVSEARNLARDMSVPRLMALAERAVGMISVDTGPAHVAAALGCPVLTLFDSVTKARMYSPRGPRPDLQRLLISADAQPSLMSILPDQVLSAWRQMSGTICTDNSGAARLMAFPQSSEAGRYVE